MFARYLYEMNIDEQEFQPRGEYNLAGVHLGGMRDTTALEDVSIYSTVQYNLTGVHLGGMRDITALVEDVSIQYCTVQPGGGPPGGMRMGV